MADGAPIVHVGGAQSVAGPHRAVLFCARCPKKVPAPTSANWCPAGCARAAVLRAVSTQPCLAYPPPSLLPLLPDASADFARDSLHPLHFLHCPVLCSSDLLKAPAAGRALHAGPNLVAACAAGGWPGGSSLRAPPPLIFVTGDQHPLPRGRSRSWPPQPASL